MTSVSNPRKCGSDKPPQDLKLALIRCSNGRFTSQWSCPREGHPRGEGRRAGGTANRRGGMREDADGLAFVPWTTSGFEQAVRRDTVGRNACTHAKQTGARTLSSTILFFVNAHWRRGWGKSGAGMSDMSCLGAWRYWIYGCMAGTRTAVDQRQCAIWH